MSAKQSTFLRTDLTCQAHRTAQPAHQEYQPVTNAPAQFIEWTNDDLVKFYTSPDHAVINKQIV